jgi:hypothetical protein
MRTARGEIVRKGLVPTSVFRRMVTTSSMSAVGSQICDWSGALVRYREPFIFRSLPDADLCSRDSLGLW